MYSFSYLEPVCCSMSSSNCCFLTCIQVSQEAGQVVWYFHLFQNFPQFLVIHTIKGIGIVNKAEIDVFLELSCFFDDPAGVGNLISGSSAFLKTSLNIWKFMVHVLLKPGLENFERYFTSMRDECNCAVVCAFFGLTFLWDWNENWPFPVPDMGQVQIHSSLIIKYHSLPCQKFYHSQKKSSSRVLCIAKASLISLSSKVTADFNLMSPFDVTCKIFPFTA